MTDKTVNFPGNNGKPAADTAPQLPPVLDVLQAGPETKVCPIMAPQIIPMPIVSQSKLLSAGQQGQMAFVRHYSPCVEKRCALWREADKHCSQFFV